MVETQMYIEYGVLLYWEASLILEEHRSFTENKLKNKSWGSNNGPCTIYVSFYKWLIYLEIRENNGSYMKVFYRLNLVMSDGDLS